MMPFALGTDELSLLEARRDRRTERRREWKQRREWTRRHESGWELLRRLATRSRHV